MKSSSQAVVVLLISIQTGAMMTKSLKMRGDQTPTGKSMIDPGPPKRVVAEVCIPDGDGGEICATAVDSFQGNGRTWVDCRVRARKLAEAARAGEEGVMICDRCETNVVVQHGGETLLCTDCRNETTDEREMERAFETDRERF